MASIVEFCASYKIPSVRPIPICLPWKLDPHRASHPQSSPDGLALVLRARCRKGVRG